MTGQTIELQVVWDAMTLMWRSLMLDLLFQGRMEMWVDMFPKDAATPHYSVDVTPRKPQA